jgi:hypothetical protein
MVNLSLFEENWKTLVSFFPTGWKESAMELGAIQRFRDFTVESLMRSLLMHIACGYSLRETAVRAKAAGIVEVSDVTLLKRLRQSGDWLRSLCLSLLEENGIAAPGLKKGINLRLFDATAVKEPGRTGSNWLVHYSLRIPGLECDCLKITRRAGDGNGESFKQYSVAARDFIIADRGYSKAPGIEYLDKAGAFVLVRVNTSSLPLFVGNGQHFPLLKRLSSITEAGEAHQWKVWIKGEQGKIRGRLCAVRKSERVAEVAHRKLLRRANRSGRVLQPETIEYSKYVIVFTTFPEDEFSSSEIMRWYRLRWQIELVFKRLKSLAQLGHLPKSDDESSRAWLYGKLFVALLTQKLIRSGRNISPCAYLIREESHAQSVA